MRHGSVTRTVDAELQDFLAERIVIDWSSAAPSMRKALNVASMEAKVRICGAFKTAKINGFTLTSTAKHENVFAERIGGGVSNTWIKLKVDLTSNENCDINLVVFTREENPERGVVPDDSCRII